MSGAPSTVVVRAAPFVVLVLVTVAVFMGGVGPLYARGLAYSAGPMGALLHVPLVAILGGASWAVLVKWRKQPRQHVGLAWDDRFFMELGLALIVGLCWITLAVLVLRVTGLVAVDLNPTRPAPQVVLAGLFAFIGSALVQQIALQSWVLALADDTEPGAVAIVVPSVLFALFHLNPAMFTFDTVNVAVVAAWLSVLNVFLFGLASSLLFFREPRRSYAVPVGFHAGWNFTQVFLAGSALGGTSHALGLCTWTARTDALAILGGAAWGFEGSVACTFALGTLVAALVRARYLPPDGADAADEKPDTSLEKRD